MVSTQAAVARATELIHESYERFYDHENQLLEKMLPEELDTIRACVQVFKDSVMCSLNWSYGLKRYHDGQRHDQREWDGDFGNTATAKGGSSINYHQVESTWLA